MAPTILIESLETVRRRVRLLAVMFGIGLAATAAIAVLLTTVLADYLLNLPALPRLMLITAAVGAVAYALWHWVIQSILARLTLNDVAGRVEKTFPQYQDRLRSTIDILSGKQFPGSEIMKQRVVSETTRLTQSLDLTRVVVARPVWYSSTAAMAAILLLAFLISTMGPQYRHIAMGRLFSPFGAVEWPKSVNIEMVSNLPRRVSVGQRMDVAIRLSKGDKASRTALIHYQYGDEKGGHFGPEEQELMVRGDDGVYRASIDAKTPGTDAANAAAMGMVKIWMTSGDDQMDLKPVIVVQRLTLSGVEASITAPPYAKLPPVRVNLLQNPAMLTFGSTVRLTAVFNKPLDPAKAINVEVLLEKAKGDKSAEKVAAPSFKWDAPVGNTISANVDATQSFHFHLHATDVDRLSNTAAEEMEFLVRPDQNPTIVIENPRRNEDRTPDATIPVQMVAEDDFGITSLKLVVDRVADKKHWEIPLVIDAAAVTGIQWNRVDSNSDLQRYRANFTWDLSGLKDVQLKPGDVLEFYALVQDNFQLGSGAATNAADGLPDVSERVEGDPDVVAAKTSVKELTFLVEQNGSNGVEVMSGARTIDMLAHYQKVLKDLRSVKTAKFQADYQAGIASEKVQTHAPVASGKLRIAIISHEQDDAKTTDVLSSVAEQITTLKQLQNTTQKQTEQLANDLAGKAQMDKADQGAADRLANQQGTLAAQTKSLATKLGDLQTRMEENKSTNQDLKGTTKDVKDLLNSAAENPMKNAAGEINNTKQEPAKEDRDKDLSDARFSQMKAMENLQAALGKMGGIGGLSRSIEKVQELLAAQQKLTGDTAEAGKKDLGKTPDQLSAEDKKKLDDLAKQQADLGQQVQKAMDQMTKDADKLTKSDPAGAKAMSQAADTGNQQNVPGKQQQASDATQNNEQSKAQSAQKQAELGLQMMLADLKEAEKHKLDELAKKLAELQQQVAILIRQQAGYNLDNLNLQGGDILARVSNSIKLDLFTEAERDPKVALPMIEIGMMSGGQEQTERNARDIAKAAEDMPDGAGPADWITKAADKMERAVVYLRDGKLPEAYNPPQTDALASLIEAKKLIDEQKKKADKKSDDQKKEAIRQQYMALLADQNNVDAVTVAIDKTHKDEDGNLPREQSVRLGQLPGDQGKLADRAGKLGEDLQSLGSIVYNYANDDIIRNMKLVKDQLGKQMTGTVTQARQQQVVTELGLIIADLETKPVESKFDQQSQPQKGGGGGKQSGMPTETELRLIKDLQAAENAETVTVSKEPKQEKPELMALGNRQGDLRSLLDRLIQKASQGKSKLPPEPKDDQLLPEESGADAKVKDPDAVAQKIDDTELEQDLVGNGKTTKAGAKPAADPDKDLSLVGDRMARARQRLADKNDPGLVTQEIQKRILDSMDDLIEQARQKQAKAQNQPPQPGGDPKPGEAKPDPGAKPQDADAQGKEQKKGAEQAKMPGDTSGGGDGAPGDPSADIAKQENHSWGNVPPKAREAVEESKGEVVLDKYKNLVDDYYRTLATKANAH